MVTEEDQPMELGDPIYYTPTEEDQPMELGDPIHSATATGSSG